MLPSSSADIVLRVKSGPWLYKHTMAALVINLHCHFFQTLSTAWKIFHHIPYCRYPPRDTANFCDYKCSDDDSKLPKKTSRNIRWMNWWSHKGQKPSQGSWLITQFIKLTTTAMINGMNDFRLNAALKVYFCILVSCRHFFELKQFVLFGFMNNFEGCCHVDCNDIWTWSVQHKANFKITCLWYQLKSWYNNIVWPELNSVSLSG